MQVTVLYVWVGEPTHRKGIVGQHILIHELKKTLLLKKKIIFAIQNKNKNKKTIETENEFLSAVKSESSFSKIKKNTPKNRKKRIGILKLV